MANGVNYYRHKFLDELMKFQLKINNGRADHPISVETIYKKVGNEIEAKRAFEYLWGVESIKYIPASKETGDFDQVQFYDKGRREYMQETYALNEKEEIRLNRRNRLLFALNWILIFGIVIEYVDWLFPNLIPEQNKELRKESQQLPNNPKSQYTFPSATLSNQPPILDSISLKDSANIRQR